jgi:hypothetical protein
LRNSTLIHDENYLNSERLLLEESVNVLSSIDDKQTSNLQKNIGHITVQIVENNKTPDLHRSPIDFKIYGSKPSNKGTSRKD